MGRYLRPTELSEALEALSAGRLEIIAGGTDYYPSRVGKPLDDDVLDITALPGLRLIEDRGDHWHIGALTTWTDLIRMPLPGCFDGFKLAAREVGGVQIQNAGTICGNICNASPAADGVPPLLTLDAQVALASASGTRSLPLADFITGNRQTERQATEIVTGLTIPKCSGGAGSTFLKLGARKYLVISIVMMAAVIEPAADGTVGTARISAGACSPVAQRLPALEAALAGRTIGAGLGDAARAEHLDNVLSPIDDVRGSAHYRRDAALKFIRRGLSRLGDEMAGRT